MRGHSFFPSDKGNKEWWGTLPPLLSNGKRKCGGTLLALCCLPIKSETSVIKSKESLRKSDSVHLEGLEVVPILFLGDSEEYLRFISPQ